ncbi:MAG: hypothetical protein AAGC49_14015 [Brevundimonas sp.]
MRRALLWGVVSGALALVIWVVASESFFRPLLAVAPVVVYSVVLLVRVVMEPVATRRVAEARTAAGTERGGLGLALALASEEPGEPDARLDDPEASTGERAPAEDAEPVEHARVVDHAEPVEHLQPVEHARSVEHMQQVEHAQRIAVDQAAAG